jgi:hypothetical protein
MVIKVLNRHRYSQPTKPGTHGFFCIVQRGAGPTPQWR